MLFVDQPSRVGFSYDVPANGTLNLATGVVESPPVDRKGPLLVNGTFPSSDPGGMPSSSAIAADAVWHLLQAFFGIFPQYAPPSPPSPIGINLFAESYGGTYGPVFAASWRRRSARALAAGDESITPIVLSSLGLVNGCIDPLIEAPLYPIMASQNTYGIEALNPHDVRLALDSYHAEHGCVSLVERCRAAVARRDSASAEGTPPDPTVDAFIAKLCRLARARCVNGQQAPYLQAGRSAYDIAHPLRDPHPPQTYAEYLNTPALRDAIGGAPTNFSAANRAVTLAFARAADSYRRPLLPVLADLVRAGTRVALLHGDRDYICNWMGGDAVASAVAEAVGGAYASGYTAAGYAPVFVNSSYIGGVTRQFGNLSFTRVYQAGHMPALSQPETAFQIFVRIVLGTSLSTGQAVDLETYASPGDPANRGHSSQSLPAMPTPTCFVRSLNETCDGEQRRMALAGEGVTINGVLYEKSADWPLYDQVHTMSREGGGSGGPSRTRVVTETPAVAMTGVYVATALPVD
jgi:carboxypeptidase C (cathepsin A)